MCICLSSVHCINLDMMRVDSPGLLMSYTISRIDCISDKSAEILNEYEEYELDTVFSAVNTEKVVISKIMNRVPSVKKKSLEMANITCSGNDIISFINCICSEILAVSK